MDKIGVSLPPVIFSDSPINTEIQKELAFIGGTNALLRALRESGVSHIELRALSPLDDGTAADRIADRLVEAGFSYTVHSALADISGKAFLSSLPDPPDGVMTVTVHAFSSLGSREENALKTIAKLKEWCLAAENACFPLKLAVEVNRRKGRPDPGDSWEGAVSLADAVGSPLCGLCFDFGHYRYNMLHFGSDPMQIPALGDLKKVIHTHIHGLVDDKTHNPLVPGSLPLREYVRALKSAGYGGIWNLEIDFAKFSAGGAPLDGILKSVSELKEALV
jgi:sugar phosphate isomerase/epimerase